MMFEWFVNDVAGIVCSTFTYLLVLYSQFVIISVVLLPDPIVSETIQVGIFWTFSLLALWSHIRAMTTNPGTVPMETYNVRYTGKDELRSAVLCLKCNSIKPERAHHCSVCKRCVKKMDHHCPWVNNCVGQQNQKFFILFTFYIFAISVHAMYMAVQKIVTCSDSEWRSCGSLSPPVSLMLLTILLFISLLFGLFTGIMFGTQIYAILDDQTGIEKLKNETATWERLTWKQNLQEVFGTQAGCTWLLPVMPSHLTPGPKMHQNKFQV